LLSARFSVLGFVFGGSGDGEERALCVAGGGGTGSTFSADPVDEVVRLWCDWM